MPALRPIEVEEYPDRVATLAEGAWGLTAAGGITALPAALRAWLTRTLQLDHRQAFASATDARVELYRALGASRPQLFAVFLGRGLGTVAPFVVMLLVLLVRPSLTLAAVATIGLAVGAATAPSRRAKTLW